MRSQRKDTPKRPRRLWKPGEIVALVAALGTFFMGLGAFLEALKH